MRASVQNGHQVARGSFGLRERPLGDEVAELWGLHLLQGWRLWKVLFTRTAGEDSITASSLVRSTVVV